MLCALLRQAASVANSSIARCHWLTLSQALRTELQEVSTLDKAKAFHIISLPFQICQLSTISFDVQAVLRK